MSLEPCCRICGCTEKSPCRKEDNEDCVLNVQTMCCNARKCLIAVGQRRRTVEAQQRREIAQFVKPIAQQFIEDRRRRREAGRRKLRKFRRVA